MQRVRRVTGICAMGLMASGVWAEDAALVIGNAAYEDGSRVAGVEQVLDAAGALRAAGVDTLMLEDGSRPATIQRLKEFAQIGGSADGLMMVLAGRFVRTDHDSYFLPVEAEGRALVDSVAEGVPLSEVLGLLGEVPGRAVLVLAGDLRERDEIGRGLSGGVGMLDIPQGVTVIHASGESAAEILRDTLARPGQPIGARVRETGGAWAQGYLPAGLAFLPETGEITAAEPAGSSEPADTAVPEEAEVETAFWQLVLRRDDADAYRAYLERYPEGREVAAARARLAALDGPFRAEREVEEALALEQPARREIQRNLVLLGHDTQGIDGIFGPASREAIEGWQEENDVAASGYLTRAQIDTISRQAGRRAAELEAEEQRRLAEARRAEETFWQETGAGRDIDGLVAFLDRYPDGQYADRAARRLAELRDARIDATGISANEQALWDRARELGTIAAYEDYANAYPRGRYANRVRQELATLRLTAEGAAQDPAAVAGEASLGLTPVTRRAVEQRLAALELGTGAVDGTFDQETRRALRRYQESAGLPVTGYLNQITTVRLLADSLRDVFQ